MRSRARRLGRWRQRIRRLGKLFDELAAMLESLTVLTNRTTRLVWALGALLMSVSLFVSAL